MNTSLFALELNNSNKHSNTSNTPNPKSQLNFSKMSGLMSNILHKYPTTLGLAGGIATPLIIARYYLAAKSPQLYQSEDQRQLQQLRKTTEALNGRLNRLDEELFGDPDNEKYGVVFNF